MPSTEMPDFAAVRAGEKTMAEIANGLDNAALRGLTERIYTLIEDAIQGATDRDSAFVPHDAGAEDEQGWAIAQIVAHVTAALEEVAAQSANMARGVPVEGRARYEAPLEELATAETVRRRLAESRRMCLAFLNAWPDRPHLDVEYTALTRLGPMNAVARYLLGIFHADGHIAQLQEAMRQARG